MQTSSKVSYDNWNDWNLGDNIMNIRPVGTYCFCHCHHCHHCHHCVDCEFTDSCVKCDHCCDCEHCKHDHCCDCHCDCDHCKHCCDCHCDCDHCKHDHCNCDCHCDPHLFPIDTDGDGFVEGDVIHKVPENYIPNPLPDNIGNNTDKNEDTSIETTSYYGVPLVDNIPDEIETVETSDDVDSILNDVDNSNTEEIETNDIFDDSDNDSDNAMNELIDTFGSDDDNWANAKLIDTDSHEIIAESPEEETELKEVEPIKEEAPTRGRKRVNRGGRRKKED